MNTRFALIREKLGMTTRKFGERLNITGGAVTNMEKGTRGITDRTLSDVCREFNVNEDWLRNGTGEMFIPTPNDELTQLAQKYNFNDLEYKFLYEYLKLDLDKRGAIVEFLENIVNSDSSLLATEEKNIDKSLSFEKEVYKGFIEQAERNPGGYEPLTYEQDEHERGIDIKIENSSYSDAELQIKQEIEDYGRELKASLGKKMSLVSDKKRDA